MIRVTGNNSLLMSSLNTDTDNDTKVVDLLKKSSETEKSSKTTGKKSEEYDQNTFHLPRQYLPQPDGGICDEVARRLGGAGAGIRYRLGRDQQRRTGQPRVPAGAAQARRARYRLRGQNRPPHDCGGLRRVRPAHRHGRGEPAQYAAHLRRRPGRQAP